MIYQERNDFMLNVKNVKIVALNGVLVANIGKYVVMNINNPKNPNERKMIVHLPSTLRSRLDSVFGLGAVYLTDKGIDADFDYDFEDSHVYRFSKIVKYTSETDLWNLEFNNDLVFNNNLFVITYNKIENKSIEKIEGFEDSAKSSDKISDVSSPTKDGSPFQSDVFAKGINNASMHMNASTDDNSKNILRDIEDTFKIHINESRKNGYRY